MKKEKLVYASAIASILSIVFVVILTIWADLNAPLKDYLKSLSGHHWVTKSYGIVLVYFGAVLLFLVLPKENFTEKFNLAFSLYSWGHFSGFRILCPSLFKSVLI